MPRQRSRNLWESGMEGETAVRVLARGIGSADEESRRRAGSLRWSPSHLHGPGVGFRWTVVIATSEWEETDLHEMTTEPDTGSHGALEVNLIADLAFAWNAKPVRRMNKERERYRLTQVCPVECLVGQPDGEISPVLLSVELDDGQTRAVDRDRVADVTIRQD